MKRTLLISAICLSASALFAGTPSSDFDLTSAADTLKQSTDTSHFFMGRREILVTNGGNDIHFIRNRFSEEDEVQSQNKNPLNQFNSHWESFNFGIGGFGSGIASTSVGDNDGYIDVDPIRSFAFHWNIADLSFPLTSGKRIGLVSGIGVSWDFYALSKKNVWLDKDDNGLVHFDTIEYKRNKLRTCNMVVPLMLEFHPVDNHSLYIMAGVEGNLRLGARTKHVTDEGVKNKHKSDFYMNPLTCNMVVRAGYGLFGVYFSTALTPMFKDNKGPVVYPFSAGVSLNF